MLNRKQFCFFSSPKGERLLMLRRGKKRDRRSYETLLYCTSCIYLWEGGKRELGGGGGRRRDRARLLNSPLLKRDTTNRPATRVFFEATPLSHVMLE